MRSTRIPRTAAAGAAMVLTLCATPLAVAGPAYADGRQYYVDCSAGDDSADGTSATTAWRSLAKVSRTTFGPGDSVLLRSGVTCNGVLAPQGSGTATAPITVSTYGGNARAFLAGGGARATVYLHNVQGWELRNLDVSDTTTPDSTARTGIYVLLSDYGTGSHYVIDNVNVHDVTGIDSTGPDNEDSGGIVLKAAGSAKPTTFDGITVSNSTVSGTDGYGIATESQWSKRDLFPGGENTYVPMTNVRITGNRLSNQGGDGIVVQNGAAPRIDHNVVNGFGLRATAYHSGVWVWNSDKAVMEYNEVSHGASAPPMMAFDADGANSDVTYQYNYSHDNGGGFLAFCTAPGQLSDGVVVRYNASVNDHDASYNGFTFPVIFNGCGVTMTNLAFYGNTVHTSVAKALIGNYGQSVVNYHDNVFVGAPGGSTITDPVSTFKGNVYYNITQVPAGDKSPVYKR
ncbi:MULTISPECIES: right-handed parallel beta-helix repeat-containing protein [Streptomyces]|uniref:Parallel beta-helix repeat protein n=1 Tax=Streptomyces nymphaeiformis TaxID=2663842 RepID=A0A7W7U8T7_9ACTN|nr:right-handed parallel beta-helix repeat-containing protein [Streptomyces nymphaeiformis]MBB4987081.1 parallel beta-helix repeat protein [Streptomyces nymphaeiformis]